MKQAKVQVAVRWTVQHAGGLRNAAGKAGTLTAAVRHLLADGLRWAMRWNTNRPLSGWLLANTADEKIFELYEAYSEALCAEAGLGGGYRFERVPRRSNFDPPEVYWPLAQDEEFAHGGELVVKRQLPADADLFWHEHHRTFSEDGSIVIDVKPAVARQRAHDQALEQEESLGGDELTAEVEDGDE